MVLLPQLVYGSMLMRLLLQVKARLEDLRLSRAAREHKEVAVS